jgi:hypothetical protein
MWIMMIKLLLEWSLYMLKRKAMLWERFSYQFFIIRQRSLIVSEKWAKKLKNWLN